MESVVVITTPRGPAKFTQDPLRRSFVARVLFEDWRFKTPGEYHSIIQKKMTQEELDKMIVIDQQHCICSIISNECQLFIDGIEQDVYHLIKKYWNQFNHNK